VTKKIGLGLAGLVCVVKHGLVMLVILLILKDTETFQVQVLLMIIFILTNNGSTKSTKRPK